MINCRMIIDAAFGRSEFFDRGVTAKDPELIGVIDRWARAFYAKAAQVDPTFFGDEDDVTGVSGVWTRPSTAEAVYYVETAAGVEVHIVPFKEREDELAPRVYRYGLNYRTVGLSGDPGVADVLTFYFSKKHPDMDRTLSAAHATNQLDSTFPDEFFDLPVARVARYLASKVERQALADEFEAEEKELQATFELHLQNQSVGVHSRHQKPV